MQFNRLRRREFISFSAPRRRLAARGAGAASWNLRIGLLETSSSSSARLLLWEALRQRLRELGYLEGQNIAFETRFAEGKSDRLSAGAAELVGLKVDVIVTSGTPATLAAKHATRTVPIVMAQNADPVGAGLVSKSPAAGWEHHRADDSGPGFNRKTPGTSPGDRSKRFSSCPPRR